MTTTQSLKKQFNKVLLSLYIISLLLTMPLVYYFSVQEVYDNANKELSLLVDMVRSMRKTISKDIRPELLRQDVLTPATAISSTVFTRHAASHFKKLQPSYYIKVASDNPLNIDNKPLPLEQEILSHFRQYRDEKKLVRKGIIDGKTYLLSSAPSISKPNCMICHDSPDKTPEQIVKTYGKKSGYGYKIGEVVGASFVGVPLDNIHATAVKRGLTLAGILTLLFTLALIMINWLVNKKILTPLTEITETTHAISQGALDRPVKIDSDNEIGELANSIELLRRSLKAMLKR